MSEEDSSTTRLHIITLHINTEINVAVTTESVNLALRNGNVTQISLFLVNLSDILFCTDDDQELWCIANYVGCMIYFL